VLLALTLGEDAVAFTDEQLGLGAELAEAIDARQERRSGSVDGAAAGPSLELGPLVELAEAVHAAGGSGELDEVSHERLLKRALRRPAQERGAGRRSTLLATVAAVAAGVALFWGTLSLVDDGAQSVAEPRGGPSRSGPAVELIRSRSTQPLFDPAIPFPQRGGESARVDTIARARAAELRANRFAMWGVQ